MRTVLVVEVVEVGRILGRPKEDSLGGTCEAWTPPIGGR